MTSYSYHNGILGADTESGWLSLETVLRDQHHPAYVYNTHSLRRRIEALQKAFSGVNTAVHYAMKANAHQDILSIIKKSGFGVDVVSLGEIKWALDNGFAAQDIIFSGVAKSKAELTFAVEQDIKQINVESLPELERIGQICQSLKRRARVGLRLNPDIKVDTHPYITTGFRENKFGLPEEQIRDAVAIVRKYQPWVDLKGLSSHLGSQIRDLSPIGDSLKALLAVSAQLVAQGFKLETLDIGGGVGIDYHTDDETAEYKMIADLGDLVRRHRDQLPAQLLLEPGRWLVARSGVLCSQVEYVKFNGFKNFLIVNTGMNHLMRPALYKAFHRASPIAQRVGESQLFDIVGPICESSDVLGHDRLLPKMKEGEWLALSDTGAYGMVMANYYNRHDFPAEILI